MNRSRSTASALALALVSLTLLTLGSEESPWTPPLQVSGWTRPQCFPWPLEPGRRLCLLLSDGLVWIDPEPATLAEDACGAWSAWRHLANQVVLRARSCEGVLQWEGWPVTFRPPSVEEFLAGTRDSDEVVRQTLAELEANISRLQEFLEPLRGGLWAYNVIVPVWAWRCGPWSPWRPLPLDQGRLRSRVCQHEEEGHLWRQWEAQP